MTVVCFKSKSSAVSVSFLSALGRLDRAPSFPSVLPVLTKNFASCAEATPERAIKDSAANNPSVVFLAIPLFKNF